MPKGPTLKISDIPADRLAELSAGRAESSHLTEALAVDLPTLFAAVLPDLGAAPVDRLRAASRQGYTRRMALAGQLVAEAGPDAVDSAARHRSDTVRGWACFARAAQGHALVDLLDLLRISADDAHFGVREWAWLAARPAIAGDLDTALETLAVWAEAESLNLRRFASEATRPRGVWCAHLPALKADPARGLPILEPLRADPARYVQDSVANWLNDAAKDQPDFVRALCARWAEVSPGAEAAYIRRRGQRSLPR